MFQPDGILLSTPVFIILCWVKIHELFIGASDIPITDGLANQHTDHAFRDRLDVHFGIARVWMEISLCQHVTVTDDEN